MLNDLKRVSGPAIVCLVLLRVSIGWQFLYEGLWKLQTLDTPQPWSAEGYLKNAQGPFRDSFRALTGDPDDLQWLDYDAMLARWENWRARFVAHYGLSDEQQQRLERLLSGPDRHAVAVSAVPESARAALDRLSDVIQYDAQRGRLIVRGETPLRPDEAARLLNSVPVTTVPGGYARAGEDGEPLRDESGAVIEPDPADLEFYRAIETLQRESARLGYRQKLAAHLKGDPDRVGVVARAEKKYQPEMATAGTGDDAQWLRYGEIQVYRDLLREYEQGLARATSEFQHQHLNLVWQKIQAKRAELVGPIRALDAELQRDARALLRPEQRAKGALPPERTRLWQVDQATIWGLIVLGGLLIIGLGTRLAAVLGAVMLVMFYLPVPPWPGVYLPAQASGPEHSFIVNKNVIEALALCALAALPTGRWFGLDGLLRFVFGRRRQAPPS